MFTNLIWCNYRSEFLENWNKCISSERGCRIADFAPQVYIYHFLIYFMCCQFYAVVRQTSTVRTKMIIEKSILNNGFRKHIKEQVSWDKFFSSGRDQCRKRSYETNFFILFWILYVLKFKKKQSSIKYRVIH